jgi:hypothetical protein
MSDVASDAVSDVATAAEAAKDELPKGQSAAAQAPDTGARWLFQLAMGLALVALADWLFYGHTVGISAALLLVALAAAAVAANPVFASKRDTLIACAILVASMVPLIINLSILSVLSGTLGTAFFTLTMTRAGTDWIARCRDAAVLLLDGTWQAFADICHAGSAWANGDVTSQRLGRLTLWVMPLALGAIFVRGVDHRVRLPPPGRAHQPPPHRFLAARPFPGLAVCVHARQEQAHRACGSRGSRLC